MAKEVNKRVTIWVNGKEVENNVKSIRAEMLKLTNQLNKTTIGSEVLPPSFFHNIKTQSRIVHTHVLDAVLQLVEDIRPRRIQILVVHTINHHEMAEDVLRNRFSPREGISFYPLRFFTT